VRISAARAALERTLAARRCVHQFRARVPTDAAGMMASPS
jgi:hypothetical protein